MTHIPEITLFNWFPLSHVGGIEVYLSELVASLSGEFKINYVFGGPISHNIISENVTTLSFPWLSRNATIPASIIAQSLESSLIRNSDLFIIHNPNVFQTPVISTLLDILCSYNTPVCGHVHNIGAEYITANLILNRFTHIFTCSEFMRTTLLNTTSLTINDITVLPYLIGLPTAADLDTHLLQSPSFHILQPTRFCNWKGSHLSLEACVDLLDSGLDIVFHHAGLFDPTPKWDPRWSRELLLRVQNYMKVGKIFFFKYNSVDTYKTMSAYDLILHPTIGESVWGDPNPIALQQAVLINSQCIGTNSGNIPNILDNTQHYIVAGTNVTALRESIKWFCTNGIRDLKINYDSSLYNTLYNAHKLHVETYAKLI
ncbi:hypothetical protein KC980_00150 [candidate division WWE3 bacterium]|uniref:Glycosyltransferase n=1 Tax=candidate division WWE3 bacterium TaxID=2053526 RepID=A0A955EC86_UNCKA|nr:hypothetical protein [candidate division WWE3 bacterium]